MDTGSTLYIKLQKSLARQKTAKKRAAAKQGVKNRKERERRENEEAGNGYHTNKQLKAYRKMSVDMHNEIVKRREEGLQRWYERRRKEAAKRKKEQERIKKKEAEKKAKEKARLKAKKEREEAKRRAKRREQLNKKLSKQMKKHNIYVPKPYLVYLSLNGQSFRWKDRIGRYKNLEDARMKINELKAAEEDIIFERLTRTYDDGTTESNYEYVIFKDVKGDEPKSTYMKNEYGKYVEHNVKINGKNYEIVEKCKAKVEDTFWVFGYDSRNDRKTFAWIFNNVLNEGFSGQYDMKRIYLYHNKVIFCNDRNEIDIIICKVASDAVRFYNLLQVYCKKGPYLFMGNVTTKSALCPSLEKLLIEKTGWTKEKLRRNQNRF